MESQIQEIREVKMVEFTNEVRYVKRTGGLSYIEAIIEVCQKYNLDEENVKNLLTPDLYTEIHEEAKKLRLVKSTGVSLQA